MIRLGTGLLGLALLLGTPHDAAAQRSRYVPLGFAGSNAVVLDLESVRRSGEIIEVSTQVWSDSVFIVDGARAMRRDDRYRVHCALNRVFDDGSVYRDSLGTVMGDDVLPVSAPSVESWTPITRGSMVSTMASHACYADEVQRSRIHRVIIVGEQDAAYLRAIPSALAVAPGDSVVLMRRTATPVDVRYGRPDETSASFPDEAAYPGVESNISHQMTRVSRERAERNLLWIATPRSTYPDGVLAITPRSERTPLNIPVRLVR